jgi:hypothetical protein
VDDACVYISEIKERCKQFLWAMLRVYSKFWQFGYLSIIWAKGSDFLFIKCVNKQSFFRIKPYRERADDMLLDGCLKRKPVGVVRWKYCIQT